MKVWYSLLLFTVSLFHSIRGHTDEATLLKIQSFAEGAGYFAIADRNFKPIPFMHSNLLLLHHELKKVVLVQDSPPPIQKTDLNRLLQSKEATYLVTGDPNRGYQTYMFQNMNDQEIADFYTSIASKTQSNPAPLGSKRSLKEDETFVERPMETDCADCGLEVASMRSRGPRSPAPNVAQALSFILQANTSCVVDMVKGCVSSLTDLGALLAEFGPALAQAALGNQRALAMKVAEKVQNMVQAFQMLISQFGPIKDHFIDFLRRATKVDSPEFRSLLSFICQISGQLGCDVLIALLTEGAGSAKVVTTLASIGERFAKASKFFKAFGDLAKLSDKSQINKLFMGLLKNDARIAKLFEHATALRNRGHSAIGNAMIKCR